MSNRPLYTIGIIAELLNVHRETIRAWERAGVVQPPQRRSGKRFYSDDDLKRLQFIHRLTEDGLNLPAVRHYLQLYPCWQMDDCPGCMYRSSDISCAKPCWKEEGTYCLVYGNVDACLNCKYCNQEVEHKSKALNHSL
ncbi:MerR family transcriptional regulator [Chloroflexota bacterium]